MFTNWVTAGGNLIAMRPDKQLAGLLGLTDAARRSPTATCWSTRRRAPGAGIVNQTMQFHGTADRYTLNGATSLATLYTTATTATANPAVTMRSVGASGGQAVAFTYDLARSVVYTRQGNPAWSGQERDGFVPIRSDDLFFGALAGDVQPDWVDLNKVAIPQADEQQRFLWNILLQINASRKPLPRFWYFPRMLKAVVIMTGDDHANGGTAGRFDQLPVDERPRLLGGRLGVHPRHVVRLPDTPIDPRAGRQRTSAAGLRDRAARQHGLRRLHAGDVANFYTTQLAQFATAYPLVPPPTTNRTHCIVWSDYTTQAQVQLDNGIRLRHELLLLARHRGSLDRPGMFTGSGMPMRFATATGQMIDVYQAATQMTDESEQSYADHINTLLEQCARRGGLLRRVHREHAHRLQPVGRRDRIRRDRRVGAGSAACR